MNMANRTEQNPKKGTLVRSLIAAALAEAIMIGSAMAVGTDAQNTLVADDFNVPAAEETTSTDSSTSSSSSSTTPSLLTMGATQRSSMGVMEVSDPQFAVEGLHGPNNASLNGADPSTMTALAMGVSSNASGGNAVAVGIQSVAASDNSVALGNRAQTGADQPYSVAVGSNASTRGTQAIALGANVRAYADNALAVGNNNTQALSKSSIAMGDGARVNSRADNSIAMGTSATVGVSATNAMALGSNANVVASAYGSIALGAGSIADRANALSVGYAGAERQIVNVAAGTQLTDAVNVSQLKGVTDALGAGAGVAPDGSITQPSFLVQGNRYSTVEQAIQAAAAGGATDSLAVRYDLNSDGSANYGSVTLGGNASAPVILTNVADGKNQYDAVNFGQLSNLQGQVDNLNQTVTNIGDRVTNIENGGGNGGGGGGNGGSWNQDAQGEKIVNVGDGAVNPSSQDAVNGSQLAATAQSTADALGGGAKLNDDGTISTPTYTVGGQQVRGVEGAVNQLDRRIDGLQGQIDGLQGQLDNTARGAYSGIAAATALTMIPGVDVGKTLSVGAGVANYKGYTAAALGGEARVSENWKVRAGVGLSSNGNTVGVGASFQW
ncbi:MAG TPA: YadA-like family protein [Dyella sp.]|uniref:YadA-like family protein n=1 Tax=Dyella sp. TaxID=1869338 RepID=UPI002CC2D2D6|nr:YadA-like family protein [Dyella sp.]HUB88191.1 YadA-like family protein [Dyella sp.]